MGVNRGFHKNGKEVKNMSISIASRKAKGRNLQYWVCNKIASLFNIEFNQQDDHCPIHSREMGQQNRDIIIREPLYSKFKYSIECKNSESFNFKSTIEQVKANTKKDEKWIIVHKRKCFKNPIVMMDADLFFEMQKKIIDNGL